MIQARRSSPARRGVARRLSVLLTAVGLALTLTPAGAGAADLEAQGWWFRLRIPGLPAELPTRPDVAPGQLLVEGVPDGPLSISALRYELADDEGNPVLTLRTAQHLGTPDTTVLLACAVDLAWAAVEGGDWDSRPYSACTTVVKGSPSADGSTWTFPMAALVEGRTLDVVLLPGRLPDGPDAVIGSTFQLVLEDPKLTTTPAPPTDPGPAPGPVGGDLTPPVASGPFLPPGQLPVGPGRTGGPASAPTSDRAPTAPVAATEEGSRALGVAILVLAGAAAIVAGRAPGRASGPDAEPIGGLGRFARPRSGPPPRLL